MKLNASDFQLLTGETSYNVDFPAGSEEGTELRLRLSADAEVKLYAVGPSSVVPLSVGSECAFEGKVYGFSGLQIVAGKKAVTVALSVSTAMLRNGQPHDPTRLVVAIQPLDPMQETVRAMVRQQLRLLGHDVDGDIADFADGDMEFDDDTDEYGDPYPDDDDDWRLQRRMEREAQRSDREGTDPDPSPTPPSSPATAEAEVKKA